MDPDQFREIRLEINKLNEDIKISAEKKNQMAAFETLDKASTLLETLNEKAEGEIQSRSVKNLKIKLKYASALIEKIKTTPKKSASIETISWDEERLAKLSGSFLAKLFDNMDSDTESQVCLSTTGKGVKPSYQIDFGNGNISAFSGSNHKKLKRKLPKTPGRTSPPFSFSNIKTILDNKH